MKHRVGTVVDPHERWRVADVVAFEHFVRRTVDDPAGEADRAAARVGSDERRVVFRAWLARVRVEGECPGTAYDRGRRIVQFLAVACGFVLGVALIGALLSKSESEPINAPLFFGVTVGLQLVVLVVAIGSGLFVRSGTRLGPVSDVVLVLIGVCTRLVDRLPGTSRAAVRARWAALDLRSTRLAPLVGCQALVVTQLFAIAFNVGLIVAMLLVYLPFVDLRFGWQSSYSFTASGIATWVRLVALPWSWFADALAPSLEVIARTQYARGQRADALPIESAHAWWPFLVMSIAVYGLALRTLVAVVATVVLRRRLASLAFTSPEANLLWRRIRGALIVGAAQGDDQRDADGAMRATASRAPDLLIIDREIADQEDAIRARVTARFGVPAQATTLEVDDDTQARDAGAARCIVVAVAATRDPIVAIAGFLRTLGSRVDELTVVLVGTTSDERLAIWRRFVAIERLAVAVTSLA